MLEVEDYKSRLQGLMTSDSGLISRLGRETQNCLHECLERASTSDVSLFYLMRVLMEAKGDNFNHLTRQAVSSNYVPLTIEKNSGPTKLSATQKLMIERRRKRKMNSVVVPLAMYPGNFRRMESELGSTMNTFATNNKGYAKLENDMNTKNMAEKKAVTYVRIWGNPEGIQTLQDRFRAAARKAQQKMDAERVVSVYVKISLYINVVFLTVNLQILLIKKNFTYIATFIYIVRAYMIRLRLQMVVLTFFRIYVFFC